MMMLRYVFIFVLGLLTIPYVHSQDTSEATAETTITDASATDTITAETTTAQIASEETITAQTTAAPPTTSQTSAVPTNTAETLPVETTAVEASTGETTTSPPQNLGLILGLSLGIGIPVLLLVVGGLIYFCKKSKSNKKVNPNNDTGTSNTTADAIVDIPLAPTKTAK